jgi:hypothetical protein
MDKGGNTEDDPFQSFRAERKVKRC